MQIDASKVEVDQQYIEIDPSQVVIDQPKKREPASRYQKIADTIKTSPNLYGAYGAIKETAQAGARETAKLASEVSKADPYKTVVQSAEGLGRGMVGFGASVLKRVESMANQLAMKGDIDWETVKAVGDEQEKLMHYEPTDPGAKAVLGAIGSVPAGVKLFFSNIAEKYKDKPNVYAGLMTIGDIAELGAFGEVMGAMRVKGAKEPMPTEAAKLDATFAKDAVRQRIAKERAATKQRPLDRLAKAEGDIKADTPAGRAAEADIIQHNKRQAELEKVFAEETPQRRVDAKPQYGDKLKVERQQEKIDAREVIIDEQVKQDMAKFERGIKIDAQKTSPNKVKIEEAVAPKEIQNAIPLKTSAEIAREKSDRLQIPDAEVARSKGIIIDASRKHAVPKDKPKIENGIISDGPIPMIYDGKLLKPGEGGNVNIEGGGYGAQKRTLKAVARDLNTLIGTRGEIGVKDFTPAQQAALLRLKNDIDVIKKNAEKTGKSVEKYLVDLKFDPGVAKALQENADKIPKYAKSINLEKQDIPDYQKQFEAELLANTPKKKQTWGETEKLADGYVKDVNKAASLFERAKKGRLHLNAEKVEAMRQININAIGGLKRIVEEGDIEQANKSLKNYQENIANVLSDTSSEIGRMLNIHKRELSVKRLGDALSQLKDGMNKRQFEELRKVNLDNPVEVKQFIKNMDDPKLRDYVLEYWYNSILSGPPTHIVNLAGNTLWLAYQVPHRALSAAVDKAWTGLTGKKRTRFLNEVVPMMAGYYHGGKRGLKTAKEVFKTGKATKFEDKWYQELDFAIGAFERSPNKTLRKIAPYITAPTRALRAMDVWANSMAFDARIRSIARREADKKGITGEARKKFEDEFAKNTPDDALRNAQEHARHSTFMDEPDPLTQWFINLRSVPTIGTALRMTVLPFVNTISNLTKRGIEMTPGLGIAKEAVSRKMGRGMNDAEIIAKQIEGAVIALYVMNKVESNDITGPMPESKSEREAWYRMGKKPWSIKVGDTWYQYRRIEPFNTVIGSVAIAYDKIKKNMESGNEKSATEVFGEVADGIKWNILDGSYFSGLQTIFNRHGKRKGAVAKWTSSFVPYSSFWRSINRSAEVLTEGEAKPREGNEWLKAFSQVVPGLSGKLPAKLTVYGEESVIPGDVFQQWLPFKWSKETNDKVELELSKIKTSKYPSGIYPSLPQKTVTYNGKEIDLDDQTYRSYCIDYGANLKNEFDRIVGSSRWSKYQDSTKVDVLKRIQKKVSMSARRRLIRNLIENKRIDRGK